MLFVERKHIPIFFSVDDTYIPYLSVAIQSVIENGSAEFIYDLYILTTGISIENCKLILGMETENTHISFVCVREHENCIGSLSLRDYYSAATYYRLLIPEIFPDIERGIYLDCDVVVTSDVSEIYFSDLGEAIIGAVTDEVVTGNEIFSRYVRTVLPVEPHEYFNAGVLVMNLKKMRDDDFLSSFFALREKRSFPVAQDQDYLNVLCHDDVCFLPGSWNKTPFSRSEGDLPKLIHFKLNLRPWRYDGVPYGEVFWEYANNTPFSGILRKEKENYTESDRQRDAKQGEGLIQLAEYETKKALMVAKEA